MSNEQIRLGVGLHYGVPAGVYHADPTETPSLSSSMARVILAKSPAHVVAQNTRLGGEAREQTASMAKGTVLHSLISGVFDEVEIGQFADFRSGDAKAWRDGAIAQGKTPILEKDIGTLRTAAGYVRERAAIGVTERSPFCEQAKSEVTCIWKEGDVFCRARFDTLIVDEHRNADVWDWKSCADISDRGIELSIAKYRYDIQAAFYIRGLESLGFKATQIAFIFVFFETEAPYTVRRVVLSAEYLAQSRKEVSEAIQKWQQCQQSGTYPVTPPDTLTVEIPHWLSENDGEINID